MPTATWCVLPAMAALRWYRANYASRPAYASLKIVVFCDNSLNRIELKQMARQYPSSGTVIDETDMIKLAESMDCNAASTDNAADLERILSAPQRPDKPLLIAAQIDPAQYAAQFLRIKRVSTVPEPREAVTT